MNFNQADVEYFDDLRRRRNEPSRTPVENARVFMGLDVQEPIMGTFLQGVQRLKDKTSDAIIGPKGGVLVLDEFENLVFQRNRDVQLLFSADNFLGQWAAVRLG